jgi:hypothetical protein
VATRTDTRFQRDHRPGGHVLRRAPCVPILRGILETVLASLPFIRHSRRYWTYVVFHHHHLLFLLSSSLHILVHDSFRQAYLIFRHCLVVGLLSNLSYGALLQAPLAEPALDFGSSASDGHAHALLANRDALLHIWGWAMLSLTTLLTGAVIVKIARAAFAAQGLDDGVLPEGARSAVSSKSSHTLRGGDDSTIQGAYDEKHVGSFARLVRACTPSSKICTACATHRSSPTASKYTLVLRALVESAVVTWIGLLLFECASYAGDVSTLHLSHIFVICAFSIGDGMADMFLFHRSSSSVLYGRCYPSFS